MFLSFYLLKNFNIDLSFCMTSLGSPHPYGTRPHESTLFTPQNVAIDWLQFGKAQDHYGLVGECMPMTSCSYC